MKQQIQAFFQWRFSNTHLHKAYKHHSSMEKLYLQQTIQLHMYPSMQLNTMNEYT